MPLEIDLEVGLGLQAEPEARSGLSSYCETHGSNGSSKRDRGGGGLCLEWIVKSIFVN